MIVSKNPSDKNYYQEYWYWQYYNYTYKQLDDQLARFLAYATPEFKNRWNRSCITNNEIWSYCYLEWKLLFKEMLLQHLLTRSYPSCSCIVVFTIPSYSCTKMLYKWYRYINKLTTPPRRPTIVSESPAADTWWSRH